MKTIPPPIRVRVPNQTILHSITREITIDDAYAIQQAWVALKASFRPSSQRSQNRPHLQGHAILIEHQRARLRLSARRHVLLRWRRTPLQPLHSPSRRSRTRLRPFQTAAGPDCSIFDVLNATDYVVPAIEIIDARIHQIDPETKVTRKVFDTISDNAANAALSHRWTSLQAPRCRPPLDLCHLLAQRFHTKSLASPPPCSTTRQWRRLARQ